MCIHKKNIRQFSEPYGINKYGSVWSQDVENRCLEFNCPQNSRSHIASRFGLPVRR